MKAARKRCTWPKSDLAVRYHDEEWGVPVHDDRTHFELLTLEGAQAGLSWEIVLRKRERYRELFADFDPQRVSRFTTARLERLLTDPGIVRNRAKVFGTQQNARAILRVQAEFGSFDAYVWRFVDGRPVRNRPRNAKEVPVTSAHSDALSKDLRARGFTFAGSTICYSYLQAAGLVDDHERSCFRSRR